MVVEVSTEKPELTLDRSGEDNDGRAVGGCGNPCGLLGRTLGARRWVSERILLGKPVWDRPSQRPRSPEPVPRMKSNAAESAQKPRDLSAGPIHDALKSSLHRAEEPAVGRLCGCWDCVDTPAWGPRLRSGSKVPRGCETSARVSEGQSRQGAVS